MPRSAVFPYGITLREGGRIELFPAAEVSFRTPHGEWTTLFLIVDSGATISALPKTDAAVFGIAAEGGTPVAVSGMGQEPLRGWQHILKVRLGGTALHLPIVFIENESIPRVLGRAGIFGRFLVIFDEQRRRSGFMGERTPEARQLRKVLAKI